MKKTRWLAPLGGAALLAAGCTVPTPAEDHRPLVKPDIPAYVYYADAVLLRWVGGVIDHHGMTDLPASALIFLVGNTADGKYREVEVRENHQPLEQLNPEAARRLFAIRINLANGALTTDASHFDGKTFPQDGTYRLLVPEIKHARHRKAAASTGNPPG